MLRLASNITQNHFAEPTTRLGSKEPNMRWNAIRATSAVNLLLAAGAAALLPGCPGGPRCGDGVLEAPEACDDGNTASGDGCSATCTTEGPLCGNGTVDTGEECDDGAANSDVTPDACRTTCMAATCGDTVVDTGEMCDPPGMTCSATCQTTTGAVCGNLLTEPGEACDDGNTMSGDGCSATCMAEPFMCPVPTAITCDTPVMGTLAATGGFASDYCMANIADETSGEQVFSFAATATEEVVFHLTGLAGDLDVIVTNACDPDACVAVSLEAATTPEAAGVGVTSGTTYYVFVDGYMGATGAFTLRAGCESSAVCGDGQADGGEDCDDGNMVSGDGCSAGCLNEIDVGLCAGDTPPGPTVLVAGTPTTIMLGDVSASTNVANISCNNTGVFCSGMGPEIVAEVLMPMGTTDLTMMFDHTGGDELYAVTAGDMMTCVELECFDPFPDVTGTHTFAGVSDGLADTTVFLVADACDADGPSGVATTVTLTAD